ncbi:MAG: bifunctional UDP-N-acetylglucosamine diphosphorylase/glucosamine-1-phosphate N-acetyltransferase GlmU [Kyrpidia tusciae]|nr:bifunctional UDP-N-acetylglucosamine diphosphorylase/glucosamine-1-phosphate N-acetyltransferase GlmU [Kyrpidia tusciae]MBE3552156.1 bifunctional UDP-N-acetylglucosamine diphosphorylase/glucosamine-1-phosphate N-acetyltransferase GlmU [Kyrpidia tusciae]
MTQRNAVVLAAGLGTRMKSRRHKVVHEVCGQPMIRHVVDHLKASQVDRIVVVVGHLAEQVRAVLGDDVEYVFQERALGTGHAVLQAAPLLEGTEGQTLVVCGDTPLIRPETFQRLADVQRMTGAAAAVLTAVVDHPEGYGRIVRDGDQIRAIVEEKDADEQIRAIREVNAGTYCFDTEQLFDAVRRLDNGNRQGEYYLTDCAEILQKDGRRVTPVLLEDAGEMAGVNDRVQLAAVEESMRRRILEYWMREGVTVVDPRSTYVDSDVVIGRDTVIFPGTWLQAGTRIGEDCRIGPAARLSASVVEDGVRVEESVVLGSTLRSGCTVGPFAYVRPGSDVGPGAKIGDFVEVKNAVIGAGTKAAHLTYIGDADVGEGVVLGCGTITVNYDGVQKHRTRIGDRTFVGCNSNLVAPLTVGADAYVAAGSTITEDVPDGAMAIARERQINKEGYTAKLQHKLRGRRMKSEESRES